MTFIGSTFAQRVSVLVLVAAALVGIGALTASHGGGTVLAGDVSTTATTTTTSTPTTPPTTPNGGNQDWV